MKAWYISNTYIFLEEKSILFASFLVEIFKSIFRIGESLNLLYLHFETLNGFSPFTWTELCDLWLIWADGKFSSQKHLMIVYIEQHKSSQEKTPHFNFFWNATFSDLSVTEMCWMAGTFQWQFSQLSLPIQSPFNNESVILFLRNQILNCLSLNYAEKNSQTVYKHTVIIIFAVLTLLVIVYWVD